MHHHLHGFRAGECTLASSQKFTLQGFAEIMTRRTQVVPTRYPPLRAFSVQKELDVGSGLLPQSTGEVASTKRSRSTQYGAQDTRTEVYQRDICA